MLKLFGSTYYSNSFLDYSTVKIQKLLFSRVKYIQIVYDNLYRYT